jgi:hypothetical protein
MGNLRAIGWWFWNKMNPNSKQFTTTPLTAEDIKNGYVAQPVYIDIEEIP